MRRTEAVRGRLIAYFTLTPNYWHVSHVGGGAPFEVKASEWCENLWLLSIHSKIPTQTQTFGNGLNP